MLLLSPFAPTTEDVNIVVDRFLPRSYARPYLYNALVSLAKALHDEASNAHPTALQLSLQPDTSKWTVEGRQRDAEVLHDLIQENNEVLKLVVRRRLYALKRRFIRESKEMSRALSSSSSLVSSAMDKRRQALALNEFLPHMKGRSFVYNNIMLQASQLEREAELLEQITNRAGTNTRAIFPTILKDTNLRGRFVTNPPASLEERKKDIVYLEELLYSLSMQEEDQDSNIHTHLLLCLQECHRDAKALERHMAVLKDVHDLETGAMSLIEL